jgi:hypothetical protein
MSNRLKNPKVIIILIAVLAATIGVSAYALTVNIPATKTQGEFNAPINSPLTINNQTLNVTNSTIYADNSTIVVSPTPEVPVSTTVSNIPSPTPVYANVQWHEISRTDTQLSIWVQYTSTDVSLNLSDKLYVEVNGVQYFATITPPNTYTFNVTLGSSGYKVGTTVPCQITQTP